MVMAVAVANVIACVYTACKSWDTQPVHAGAAGPGKGGHAQLPCAPCSIPPRLPQGHSNQAITLRT